MSISEENKAIIITRAKAVEEPKTTGMTYDKFVKEYARYLAQADKDKDALIGAKFDWAEKEIFDDYLYMLTDERAARIVAEGKKSAAQDELESRMPTMKLYRDSLIKVCKFIDKRTKSAPFKSSFKMIEHTTSTINILNNIITMSELIETEPELAARISPGHIDITPEYLKLVQSDARSCISLEATAYSSDNERSEHVANQNKILTLCMDAISEIVEYADSAFLTNREYFNEHYTNHVRRAKYKSRVKEALLKEKENETVPPTTEDEATTNQETPPTENTAISTEQEVTTAETEQTITA